MGQKYSQLTSAILTICYLTMLCITSCKSPDSKDIDISKENLKVQSIRYDLALYGLDTNQLANQVDSLGNAYPDFSAVFFNQLTGFRKNNDELAFQAAVKHFLTYKDFLGMMDTVKVKFPHTKDVDQALETLFKHIHYYYPNQRYETVYYFVSGLNYWKTITIDSIAAVGLDMFLGKDYPYYASVQIPAYQTFRCDKQYIPVFMCKTIYEKMFPIITEQKTLLDLMIQNGKELLFMEYCLPKMKPEDLIGYTSAQWTWCEANEAMIWNYFTKTKLLYSTQWQEMLRYVNEAPTSTGMPPESPGNIGSFIGWQIIKAYWKKHPSKTLTEIIEDANSSQQLLELTQYKPRA